MTGSFIVLEGGEGSGKSTQAQLLYERLVAFGRDAVLTYEPGDSSLGEEIRQLLLHREDAVDERAELLLMLADRAQHVATVVKPALARMPSSCATGSRPRRSPTRASGARSGSKRSNG